MLRVGKKSQYRKMISFHTFYLLERVVVLCCSKVSLRHTTEHEVTLARETIGRGPGGNSNSGCFYKSQL